MSAIKAGDLVVVTRAAPCCNCGGSIGLIFTVESVGAFEGSCTTCGTKRKALGAKVKGAICDVDRLTRIDPLPESETHRDEVTA